MKFALLLAIATTTTLLACGQNDPSKSPPATVKETIKSGAVVTINYSQPSVRGRTIGKDLEPLAGQVWRTGANEATTFTVSKDVKVQGKTLPAGTYGFFTLSGEKEWTIIFNKTAKQWGAFKYKEADDVLRVMGTAGKTSEFAEKLKIDISKSGMVTLNWGDHKVDFTVE